MKIKDKLKEIQQEKRAILAANFYNLETCQGIVRAASALKQPVILQVTPGSIGYMGLKTAVGIARNVTIEENAKTWLHLDHCPDIELIKKCLDEGFDSVMIDVSDKSFEENIRITKKAVSLTEGYGVNIEAELGYVPKPDMDLINEKYTTPSEAKRFVEETGVSSLAIAIGSKHGFYKGTPKLDIERLEEIRKATDVFLVLHGASGIPADVLKEAIINGITKVNIATETKDIFMRTLKSLLKTSDEIDLRKVFPAAVIEVQKLIEHKLKMISILNEN